MVSRILKPKPEMIVLITGCDTGLGFHMAREAASSGFTVVAGLLKGPNSEEAIKLKKSCGEKQDMLHLLEMDVSKENSVKGVANFVENMVKSKTNYHLHSVVNNAGVMIFGESEWQTSKQIRHQLEVNLYGPILVYSKTAHLLRKSAKLGYHPRLVLVNSHCSIQSLPGLSVYGATKWGLKGWEEALRMEICKHGISLVKIIPGSHVTKTKILSNQKNHSAEMKENFTPEQTHFYGDYFNRYVSYLNMIEELSKDAEFDDKKLMEKFMKTLVYEKPKSYKHEPLRYRIYHFLFGLFPFSIRRILVEKFMMMPTFKPKAKK